VRGGVGVVALGTVMAVSLAQPAPAAVSVRPSLARIIGEIERIHLNDPNDVWSGGTIVVGGQNVIIPRNLLADLPANRLTLQQVFAGAPAGCVTRGESGLAKTDRCNTSGAGGIATIEADRTRSGDVIAGDVFLQKGAETIFGTVSFINFDEGWVRVNGTPGDASTGVMVRLNDPTGRHTVQAGAGCQPGAQNCSPDPRFTEDPDNYTQAFSTGYPLCIPSTVKRTFTDTLNLAGNGTTATATAQAAADGTGDVLCPEGNRNSLLAKDSRRLAPLKVGDDLSVFREFRDGRRRALPLGVEHEGQRGALDRQRSGSARLHDAQRRDDRRAGLRPQPDPRQLPGQHDRSVHRRRRHVERAPRREEQRRARVPAGQRERLRAGRRCRQVRQRARSAVVQDRLPDGLRRRRREEARPEPVLAPARLDLAR
jgi:hypothetical protein